MKEKLEAQRLWNANPCGTGEYPADMEYGSIEFFDEVRRSRYEISDTWIKETIDFSTVAGKKLLEIGHGIGTDLLTFCEEGAQVYGIDISEEHHRLAKLNFYLHRKDSVLKLCDSADIDFPSNYFDVVYTLGALHHTPDTVRCISEAYRVLKSGGQLILCLYHTYSGFHIFAKLIYDGILRRKLRQLGYRGLMSTIERGADGIHVKPLVKTYSKKQLRYILEDFVKIDFKIAHFKREHIPFLGMLIPQFLEKPLATYLGWYVIAFATK